MDNKTKKKIDEVARWLNENYSQQNEFNFDTVVESWEKPCIVRYDEHTAVACWSCGAVVCIGSMLYFIWGDDGIWVVNKMETKTETVITGMLSGFTVMLAGKLSEALTMMEKYVRENGKYVEETERTIAHYTL
jgi:hypothetical protein